MLFFKYKMLTVINRCFLFGFSFFFSLCCFCSPVNKPPLSATSVLLDSKAVVKKMNTALDDVKLSSKGTYTMMGVTGKYSTVDSRLSSNEVGFVEIIDRSDPVSSSVGRFSMQASRHKSFPSGLLTKKFGTRHLSVIRIHEGDIREDIQNINNANAIFVLPSQLNGAEYPSYHTKDIVKDVVRYRSDKTSGPRGQLACDPRAAQFILDSAASTNNIHGINAVRELLNVEALQDAGFKLVNGYLYVPRISDQGEEGQELLSIFRSRLHTLSMLLMEGVRANGLHPRKNAWGTAQHRVNLIYASAVPVGVYLNSATRFTESIAQMVLIAQYYGALEIAFRRNLATERPTKIFFMTLGGGAFNNRWEHIMRSISVAVELFADAHGLTTAKQIKDRLDIQLLTWKGKPSAAVFARKELKNLNKLVKIIPAVHLIRK